METEVSLRAYTYREQLLIAWHARFGWFCRLCENIQVNYGMKIAQPLPRSNSYACAESTSVIWRGLRSKIPRTLEQKTEKVKARRETQFRKMEEEGTENKVFSKLLLNSDLFDPAGDESGSDEDRSRHTPSQSPTPPTSPANSALPPKGRRRKTSSNGKEKKRSRLKKTEVQYIHSESQRLMRESSVSLPKYQPKTKTLDSFLTKLRSRGAGTATPKTHTNRGAGTAATPKTHTSNKEKEPLNKRASDTTEIILTSSIQDQPTPIQPLPPSSSSSITPPACVAEPHAIDGVGSPGSTTECGLGDGSGSAGLTTGTSSENQQCEKTPDVPCQAPTVDSNSLDSGSVEQGSREVTAKDTETATKADRLRSERRALTRPTLGQTTLLGLFASRNKEPQEVTTEPSPPPPPPPPPPPLTPQAPSPDPAPTPGPKLSSADNFLLVEGEGAADPGQARELTGVELLQQRFVMHALKVKTEGAGSARETGGVAPLIPEDTIAKLRDKPGAVRQHWRCALHQQLSQRRAEERKQAEEMRRLFSEEVQRTEEEEEEGELSDRDTTDAETSDEEYAQDEVAANAGSDVCSDLEEDEGNGDGEAGGGGNDDGSSDGDEELYTFARPARKPRVLESDDEESKDGNDPLRPAGSMTVSGESVAPRPMYEDTCSMSVFGDAPSAEDRAWAGPRVVQGGLGIAAEEQGKRKLGLLAELEEASMPPLVLNESFESDESSAADSPKGQQWEKDAEIEAPTEAAATERQTYTGFYRTSGDSSSADTSLPECKASTTQTAALPADSGLGMSLGNRSHTQSMTADGSGTQPVQEEESQTEPVLDGDSTSVGDNSLELSFQWGASLPPAQPQRDPSLKLFGSAVSRRDRSPEEEKLPNTEHLQDPFAQWDDAPPPSPPQASQMDEETQFLDANGFLCLRKEKKLVSPVGSSTLKSIVDPSQELSSSELLALCSGNFDETQSTAAAVERERRRHPSDSSSSQTVRELLGLPAKPPLRSSISKLLASNSVNSEDTQGSCMNEVLGLCSGVFPTAQPATTRPPKAPRSMQSVGTSDGVSSDSEDGNVSGGEGAVLRWAQRQRRPQETGVPRVAPLPPTLGRYSSDSEDEDMPVLAGRKRRSRPKPKPTREERLAEFVESEAELSGEEEDLAGEEDEEPFSGPDEYEEEEGAGEDLPLSDSELWDQVNKAHMKHTLADDKADLQEFKERFLRDGDLFEDGLQMKNGFFRTRRFARPGSEQGSVDLFAEERGEESDGEAEVVGSQAEALRRKDRLEREEFIRKCRETENSLLTFDEDSQSILEIIKDTSHSLLNTPTISKSDEMPRPASTGCKRTRCGSFLKHNTATLRRLSSLTASTPSVSASGKNFVFQRSDTHTPTSIKSTGGSKATPLAMLNKATPLAPLLKKPRLDRSSSLPSRSNSSIFSILN